MTFNIEKTATGMQYVSQRRYWTIMDFGEVV